MSRHRKLHRLEWWLLLAAVAAVAGGLFIGAEGRDFVAAFVRGWVRIGAQFRVVNTSMTLVRVVVPAILCGAFVYCLVVLNPKPGRWTRVLAILVLSALYTAYMAFRLFATLNLDTVANAVFSILFLLAELLIYLKSL